MRNEITRVAMLGLIALLLSTPTASAQGYTVVDTGQKICYDDDGAASTRLRFYPTCPVQSFQVVTGLLSELIEDGDFSQATCLGTFDGEDYDSRPAPSTGEGYYYLAKELDPCP